MKKKRAAYSGFRLKIEQLVKTLLNGCEPTRLSDDKVIRDTIFGFNVFFKHEINIIDSPLIQRLRRIHQTALAFLTYPSATHTRFEHSLGVAVIADKMIKAINDKYPSSVQINSVQRAEVRLAAILHDCGHGPFSHASEQVFGNEPFDIPRIKQEQKSLLGKANAHEIIAYCVVTSGAFKEFWDKVVTLYDLRTDRPMCDLRLISLDRVASMIIGKKAQEYPLYLSQIINGPFDADKFDYILRDGYFTGLVTSIDVDRLFISLDYAPSAEHSFSQREDLLCMDVGGATVLEQVLFNKMVLYSSFYHHHKVRTAFRCLVYLWDFLRVQKIKLNGVLLDDALNFLRLDDFVLLGASAKELPKEIHGLLRDLRNRNLPKRCLVITKDGLIDSESRAEYFRIRDQQILRMSLERQISDNAKVKPVFVDFPEEPAFAVSGLHSIVKLGSKRYVTLDQLYPASGWVSGYAEYRYRSYVFSPPGTEIRTANVALEAFGYEGVRLDKKLCFSLAKIDPAA